MGMGYGSNYADVIDEKNLAKINRCGELLDELKVTLEKGNTDLERFAFNVEFDNDEIEEEIFRQAEQFYQALQKEFEKETGLELWLGYHDSNDSGDRYDGVNGHFFGVEGCYQPTKELKALQKKFKNKTIIERQYYVTFG